MQEVFENIIEKLDELIDCNPIDGYEKGKNCAVSEAIEIVEQEAEQYNNGWIPCSERLPETSGFYLVSTVTGVVGSVSYYIEQESRVMHTSLGTAIAWQPLPEPYRTKEE